MWKKLDKQEEIIKTKATLYKLNHESSELDEQITELSSSCT
jgi:cell division protein FtsL